MRSNDILLSPPPTPHGHRIRLVKRYDQKINMQPPHHIADVSVRRSAITSHTIGVPELAHLLEATPPGASLETYEHAVLDDNILGLATESGRDWRFATLRRLYLLSPDAVLFRALRDLWPADTRAQPLLAALCAMATDTVLRASASVITATPYGEPVTSDDFAVAIDGTYPGVYATSTLKKASQNAYASWQQSGHLGSPHKGKKIRRQAVARPANVAYALLLGYLLGHRGETLFSTIWTQVLDETRSGLESLVVAAGQQGMLEYRSSGGVVEVGFQELLRPVEGALL